MVLMVVGLCGFLPIYPRTVMRSMRHRAAAAAKKEAELAEKKSDDNELNSSQS